MTLVFSNQEYKYWDERYPQHQYNIITSWFFKKPQLFNVGSADPQLAITEVQSVVYVHETVCAGRNRLLINYSTNYVNESTFDTLKEVLYNAPKPANLQAMIEANGVKYNFTILYVNNIKKYRNMTIRVPPSPTYPHGAKSCYDYYVEFYIKEYLGNQGKEEDA